MATTVRITETYDLKTSVNKIGLIGVHTPSGSLINRLYPGLVKNHRFIRFLKCDVTGACASVLPADPLQVGVASGEVAPEDMFNPILYRAVTNESFDTISGFIYNQSDIVTIGSVNAGTVGSGDNAFKAYYALLAENGRYKKSMPQSGFSIRGLVPICHTLISTFGNVAGINNFVGYKKYDEDSSVDVLIPELADTPMVNSNMQRENLADEFKAFTFRGKSVRMPKLPLHYTNSAPSNRDANPVIPTTFVLAMIVPPAKLHEFYYRMRVTWTIRFEQVMSVNDTSDYPALYGTGGQAYARDYTYSSSKAEMENLENMVDTDGVSINKIMES